MRQSLQQKSYNLNRESRKVLSGEVALKLTPAAQVRCSQTVVEGSAGSKGATPVQEDAKAQEVVWASPPGLREGLLDPALKATGATDRSTQGNTPRPP